MNPAPSPDHQSVSKHLQHFLYSAIELPGFGKVFNAPIDVQLGDNDIVQPDLIVILKGGKAEILKTRIKGAPDLVVEILSPSTSRNDQSLKLRLYEQSGVQEYWIVDPTRKQIRPFELRSGKFHSHRPVGKSLRLKILPEVVIPVPKIFRG